MPAPALAPAALSKLDQDAFTAALAGIYEHSPWIPARAWTQRPFARRADVQAALERVVDAAGRDQQLALLRAHPELAGKAAVCGELTVDSRREQAGAGLDQCSPEEFETLLRLNQSYGERFGFPFIIAVRGLTRADIIAAMARRVQGAVEEEFTTALGQVKRIAAIRLADCVAE